MADSPIDPKAAYLAGVLDGFHLARAESREEVEQLITAINKDDVADRIRAARAEYTQRLGVDGTEENEREPPTRLN